MSDATRDPLRDSGPEPSARRWAIDTSKIDSLDGLGAYTRGLVGALEKRLGPERVARIADPARAGDPRAEEVDGFVATTWRPWDSRRSRTGGRATARLPTVFVVYDLTFLSHPQTHTLANRLHCLEGCLRALEAGDRFVAISQATRDALEHWLGVAPERVRIAYPAPSPVFDAATRSVEISRARVRARFGLGATGGDPGRELGQAAGDEPQTGYVLAVGSLEPRKNLEALLVAHRRLPPSVRARFPLAVAGGGGWRNQALERALEQAAAEGTVARLGQPTDEELADLYRAATLFVYPSLAEGFGLPVIEAMACGAPVLASDTPAVREVAGDAARLVEPSVDPLARALTELLDAQSERQRLARRGLERAHDFRWDHAAEQVLAALEEAARAAPA